MRTQTFYDWLTREVASSRMALIRLYEKRDHILYVEAPPLRKKYMAMIGTIEEPVLQAELEVSLLRRKLELIQTARNRREELDIAALDAQMEQEKAEQIAEVEQRDKTLQELPTLTAQQEHTMQRQYREITSAFHPALNAGLSETQKELYQKAMDAYQMQDTDAMKLIYEELFSPAELSGISLSQESSVPTPEERREAYRNTAAALSTDYSLAKKLYSCFSPLEQDAVMLDSLHGFDEQRRAVEKEISQIKDGFPFNAVPTMQDRAKMEEYVTELRLRAMQCQREKAILERKIAAIMEDEDHD